ncbi:uncharacterized protein EI90DRAFT_3038957, partial [Cantharellus anzutake]|uniref:uncharacterized protein n=1 Tax=Cantharellus anzutake TaxID=1750568 RepID=UPI001903B99F
NGNGDEAQETSSEDLLVKALMATKRVAHDVDVARAKRDIEVKTQRIVDRLDPTSSISSEFVASLGDIRLASSLDLIYHHPSLAPLTGVVRVRYCGAFVYDGYLLLVKVRKNKNFLPLHWLSLGNVEVEDVTEEPGLLPHSFKIKVADHTLELGASCIGEKDVWLRTLITIRSTCSSGESGPPRKRRQSILASTGFYVPSGHSSHATLPATISFISSTKLGASPVSEIESRPVLAEPVAPSKMERQWTTTSKRASAGKRSSIFLLDTFTTTYRRVAATERLLVDRTLTDMWSSECISIRTQAQLRGELFSHPKPHRPASTQDLTERGPWSKAATSFPGPTHTSLSKKAATSTLYARVRRQSAPPSPPRHHKTCSVPCGSSDPDELRGHSPIRKRMVASDKLGDPVLREPDNFGYMVWPQEISDDDAESFWDDVLSVTRTKLMSEDTQFPRNGNTVTEVKSDVDSADVPLPECKLTLPPERIPDQPPSKRSSFLTRADFRNSSQVRSSSPIRSSRSTRNGHDSFLSPYWTKTSVVLRSASPIHFEPSPVVSPFPNSTPPPLPDPPEDMTGRSRSAIDLCRLEPLPSSSRKMTTSSTSSSSSATSHSARSIRSFFQHRNKFTSIL